MTPHSTPARYVAWLPALLLILGAPPGLAAPRVFHGSARQLEFTPPRVERGPAVDGALDDAVWAQAAVLDSFVQRDPKEGVPDSLGTECLVLYDAQNLYVGFRCTDRPREIRAPITNRDKIDGDWVGVALDTYHDKRKSYLFIATPHGIQADAVDQQGSDTDFSPDFIFTSKGRMTPTGYEVEMAIPFKSLRFPPHNPLTFGFEAARAVDRYGSQMFWAPITRDKNTFGEQLGTATGIAHVRPGRNLQVIPSFTGSQLGEYEAGRFQYDSKTRLGASVKYGLTSGITGDVAITPDFSQVEADAGVVDINERFAIYYEEKRPFFLEGSEIFKTPINVVYTRRIADPLYGAKVTGKMGSTSLGVLQAADRSDGLSVETLPDPVNPYLGHDANYTIARVKQDVLKSSFIGLLVGEREQLETYNRGIGVDGTLNFLDRYSLSFQRIQSWSRDRDYRGAIARLSSADSAALDADLRDAAGAITQGDATRSELSRSSKGLDVGIAALDVSPRFAADMGFIRRTDQIEFAGWFNPHLFPKGRSWFNTFNPSLSYERTYDHDPDRRIGRRTDDELELELELDLPRNSWLGAGHYRAFTYFDGREFPGQTGFFVFAGSNRYRAVQANAFVIFGDRVVFDETVPGRSTKLEAELRSRFSRQLDAALSVNGSIVTRSETDQRFADVIIPRLRVSYQHNKELSFRWITELRALREYDTAGLVSSRSQRLSLDLLGSYQVGPGTVFYLGYGSLLNGETRDAMRPTHNSAFVKLSYLWQG